MGRTWIVDGRIEVPRAARKEFQRTAITPPAKAPALLRDGEDADAVRVAALVKALAKQSGCVAWNGNVLTIGALLDAGGGVWLDWRAHLAALPGAAAAVNGSGTLTIVPAPDNGEPSGIHVVDGRITPLRGLALHAAQRRLASIVAEVVAAELADTPFLGEPELRPIHAEVIRCLRRQPPQAVMRAAAKYRGTFSRKTGRAVTLKQAFTDPESLLAALERGDPRLDPWLGGELAAAALSLLAELDATHALGVANKVLGAVGRRASSGTARPPLLVVAQTLAANAASAKPDGSTSIAAMLAALRKAMPTVAPYGTLYAIRAHPLVQQLRRRTSAEVTDAVRKALHATLGGPIAGGGAWKPLTVQRAGYAAALLEILHARPTERAALKVAYATHPHYLVADRDRAK